MQSKNTQKNKIIAEIVKNYFKEVYRESFSVFDDLENKLGVRDFNEKEEEQLKRLVSLFCISQRQKKYFCRLQRFWRVRRKVKKVIHLLQKRVLF